MTNFLNHYVQLNVKYRQLSKATQQIISSIDNNKCLHLPTDFYENYASCLENYHIENQTIVNLWKDIFKQIICSEKSFEF